MDFHDISLEGVSVVLEIVGTEIVWRYVTCFVGEIQLDFISFFIMIKTTKTFWITTLMALQKEIWDSNDIIRTGPIWEIVTRWSSSLNFSFPVTFG